MQRNYTCHKPDHFIAVCMHIVIAGVLNTTMKDYMYKKAILSSAFLTNFVNKDIQDNYCSETVTTSRLFLTRTRPDAIDCVTRPQPYDEVASLYLSTVTIDAWSMIGASFQFSLDPVFDNISPSSSYAS